MKLNVKYADVFVWMILVFFLPWSEDIRAAGDYADPPIDTAGTVISVTNGPPTCHKNNSADKVHLSVSGGDDQDCDGPGSIDYTETRWTCTSGVLDDTYASTNKWKALAKGSGFVIRVYLNDDDSDPDYDDDESPCADTQTVTGFIVGEELTTSPSGNLYKKWENGTTSGAIPAEPLYATCISFSAPTGPPDLDYDEDTCDATWKIITDPPLGATDVKGDVNGFASSSSFNDHTGPPAWGYEYWADDDDAWDSGSGSFSAGVNLLVISFGWSGESWTDSCYSVAACGIGFGSEMGIPCGDGQGVEDISDNTSNTCYASAAHSSETGKWTADPTETRSGKWTTRAETKAVGSTFDGAISKATSDVTCKFYIPGNPEYIR